MASRDDAIKEVTEALVEAGLDVRAPEVGPEGCRRGRTPYVKEYVPGETEVDNFAPERELATAARAHSGEGPLLYLHAVGA